ncbi:MAG TPA: N-acetylmuramoyl-L-alanine amidase [Thermaerobacter sp.]
MSDGGDAPEAAEGAVVRAGGHGDSRAGGNEAARSGRQGAGRFRRKGFARRLLATLAVAAGLVAGAGAGFTPAQAQAAGPVPAQAIVTGSLLNLRAGPGTEFEVIDRIPQATVVTLRTKQGGWFEVQAPSGRTGWVAGEYLTARLDGVRIVVDPGHGGTDGGAYANGLVEREVNLAIALPLRDILVARGAQVRMTREERNPNLPLWNRDNPYDPGTRTGMANSWPAHMLISVHNNSTLSGTSRGLLTIWGNAPESQTLARAIHDRLIYWTAVRQGFDHVSVGQGVYRDTQLRGHTLAITNRSLVPATIVEVAFLSNAQDAALLKNPAFLQAAAKGIADGAGAFLLDRLPDGPIAPAAEPGTGGGTAPQDPAVPAPGDGSGQPPAPPQDTDPGTNPPAGTPPAPAPNPPGSEPNPQAPAPNPPAPAAGSPFRDVEGTLAGEVERARQLGLVQGYAGNVFRPQDPVTRAEFAAMVVRAVEVARGRPLPVPSRSPFADVTPSQSLYGEVLKAAEQGYIQGTGDDRFEPGRSIRREEAAAVLNRAGELPQAGSLTFRDVPRNGTLAGAVAAVAAAGVMEGYNEDRFGYGEPITRAQAAAVVVRLYGLLAGSN